VKLSWLENAYSRGHSWKSAKQTFSLRLINRCNSLTQELVDSVTVNSFKAGLEKLRNQQMGFIKD